MPPGVRGRLAFCIIDYIIDHNSAFDKGFDRDEFMRNHILRDFYSSTSQEDRDGFRTDAMKFVDDGLLSDVKSQMPDVWLDSLMEYDAGFFEDVEETLAKEVK